MPSALIVEDEPEANRLLAMLVQLRGYTTDSAFTGGEALEKVRRKPPDIVFLDLMLPDVNGYDVCRSLKEQKATSLIPVVMVTARVALENRIQSFCLGADHYVAKPYTPDQIFHAMADADAWRRLLERSSGLEGEIPLVVGENGETLRQLARLRNLLMARTPLDPGEVCRVSEGLQDLWAAAEAWCFAQGVRRLGTLSYRIEPDRVVFVLRDAAGLLDADRRAALLTRGPVVAAGFAEIPSAEDPRSLAFAKLFTPGAAG